MIVHVGIDPGISGAVAFVGPNEACVFDLPRHSSVHRLDGFALARLVRAQVPADAACYVWLEKLRAMANHSGNAGQGASMQSMGSMMQGYGIILGALDCTRFEIREVEPRVWKRAFGLDRDKKKSLDLARRLYPRLEHDLKRVKDADRAEALLLAHFGTGRTYHQLEDASALEDLPF